MQDDLSGDLACGLLRERLARFRKRIRGANLGPELTAITSRAISFKSTQPGMASIRLCISESLLGVITGEVGLGKAVAVRALRASWMRPRSTSSTLPPRPSAHVVCT